MRMGVRHPTGMLLTAPVAMSGRGRYYSCPLDEPHLWEVLRYTELNSVRAGLVTDAESWGVVQRNWTLWRNAIGCATRSGAVAPLLVGQHVA
jgi:hypothetical protein